MIIKSYEIEKNVKKFIDYNFFLLYGENEGLKKDIKKSITLGLDKDNSSIELLSFYENDIIHNEKKFYNSIFSTSLFSDKKIIIIKNATDKIIKHINNIVEEWPENQSLIISSEILDKKSKLRNFFEKNNKTLCIPCYLDNEKNLEIIAKVKLKKDNIILSQESINLLIEKSNGDRDNLKNEIEKIQAFALNNKNIGHDEVKSLTNFSGEYKSDSLINECLCGNVLQYKKNLSEVYTNTINQVLLLRILNNKIQRLLNMKKMQAEYSNLDSLLGASKPPVFWKDKPLIKKQLTIWRTDDLKKTSSEISNIEILCKKNPQISKIIFFNFFSKICKKANSFS